MTCEQTINEFATTLLLNPADEKIFQKIAYYVIHKFGFKSCSIYLLDETKSFLSLAIADSAKNFKKYKSTDPVKVPVEDNFIGAVAKTKRPKFDSNPFQKIKSSAGHEAIYSKLAIPIIARDEIVGVVMSEHCDKGFFTEERLKVLQRIANLSAITIKDSQIIKSQTASEKAFRDSEERIRLILENALDAVIVMNANGQIISWNPQAQETFGWTKEEAIGQKLSDLIIPENLRKMHEMGMKRYLDTGKEVVMNKRIEVDALHKNGYTFPTELTVTPLKTPTGTIFSGFIRDITDQKEAKLKLEQSEERYRNLVESASDIIYKTDARGYCTYVNPVTAKLLKSHSEELVGKHFSQILSDKWLYEITAFYNHQLQNKIPNTYKEFPIVSQNGKKIWIGQKVQIIKKQGKVIGFMAVARDITERIKMLNQLKRSEEKYRRIIENVKLGLIEVDLEEKIKYANQSFCKMTGFKRDQLLGKKASDLLLENNNEKELIENQNRKRLKGKSGVYELKVRNRQGRSLWMLIGGAPMYDEENKIVGSIGIHLDITQRKAVESQLANALQKELELNELRSGFVSMASHEFRTPLTTLKANLDLLTFKLDKYLGDKKEDWVKNITRMESEVERMTRLISNILLKGKLDVGQVESQIELVDLVQVCHESIDQCHSSQKDGREVEFTMIGVPRKIDLDRSLFTHAVSNLLSNAFKYSSGQKNPELILEYLKEKIIIKIRDSGIGIPKRDRGDLFKSFFRASNVNNIPGTGLGLTIVKQFIELNGGTVKLNDETVSGTEFIIELKEGRKL